MAEKVFTVSFGEEEPDGRVYIHIGYRGRPTDLQLTPTGCIQATLSWDPSEIREIPELRGTDFRGFIKILNAWAENVDENNERSYRGNR